MSRDDHPITKQKFMEELRRYQLGSVSRRHFLGVTGLGLATAVLGARRSGPAPAPSLGGRRYRRPRRARDLAELSRSEELRGVHRRDRRPCAGQRIRVERGNAGQAAGRRQRLGRVRADQLHHHDLCRREADRAARPEDALELRSRRLRAALLRCGHRRRHRLCRAEELGHDRLRGQHQAHQGQEADELEGLLGHHQDRLLRPHHGA